MATAASSWKQVSPTHSERSVGFHCSRCSAVDYSSRKTEVAGEVLQTETEKASGTELELESGSALGLALGSTCGLPRWTLVRMSVLTQETHTSLAWAPLIAGGRRDPRTEAAVPSTEEEDGCSCHCSSGIELWTWMYRTVHASALARRSARRV